MPEGVTKVINDKSADSLLDTISADKINHNIRAGASRELETLLSNLDMKISNVKATIKAETHWRLSFGIGCIPLVLIGIGLGIIKKGGHLLGAFGVSSIPAAILIVCIMSGKNLVENLTSHSDVGMLVIWAGPVILVLLAGVIYGVLLKH